jgi:hypothetical protein
MNKEDRPVDRVSWSCRPANAGKDALPLLQKVPLAMPVVLDLKDIVSAGHWWFTPVILATQEAEIRRISI